MTMGARTLLIALQLATAMWSAGCSARAAATEAVAEAKVTLQIEGMHCASCTVTIRKALERLDGVREAQVSAKEQRAHVTFDPGRVTPERMVQAVKGAGYDASVEG